MQAKHEAYKVSPTVQKLWQRLKVLPKTYTQTLIDMWNNGIKSLIPPVYFEIQSLKT